MMTSDQELLRAYVTGAHGAFRKLVERPAGFDQRIEKGGYGFKNLTVKGMPLMFSFGGDPR